MPDVAGHADLSDELSDVGELFELVTAGRPAWQADALCREHPEVTWFPERGEPAGPAKAVCQGCLVRSECLAWAMEQDPALEGVWGGLTTKERAVERRGMAA